ncbi:MAG: hypothetical protein A2077_02345 [Nitrospirae bacterium GWC2_46_6]|nr:MAG: hypothetical protein A2Z82_11135 [Nitrospirae bacterium GWA2_46_11]OGW22830.1 MAG: hypothetical protein A2077_02345 [Nitrospirae bacterium GWC2_46_6]OGW22863.1 MAG: hypothetical protein A2X55_10025 [Nitrospirae bacterium GWB2_47_37]HAK89715.1 hypothetical protein [Nitrospiraceae bacterium]HCL80787.1 hypothetical protein [Nitrospiraceae bacterium]
MKLLLFDIDGTIMDSGGAGTRSLDLAFEHVLSIPHAFEGISMAGKTDIQIIREGLEKHNIPSSNGAVPAVLEAYVRFLSTEINNQRKHLKPGIREVLEIVKGQYGLGLLTGNIEKGARIKLAQFSLNEYFPSGAFGSDDEDRNMLLPIAIERFRELENRHIDFSDCVIIGDTPRDVQCAKPYGAFTIGTATGPYPADALIKAGADAVFQDLSDTAAFLSALENSVRYSF